LFEQTGAAACSKIQVYVCCEFCVHCVAYAKIS